MKKGIIFDMDGVLIDSMPFHAEAMRIVIKEETNHIIEKKIIYLLEGMSGTKLVKEIFKKIQQSKPIEGARELVNDLKSCGCLMAVVSGSAKKEMEAILEENVGSK